MPTFLWFLLGAFGLMCGLTVVIAVGTRYYQRRFPDSQPVFFVGAFSLTAVCLAISTYVAYNHNLLGQVLGLFVGACTLLLTQIKVNHGQREAYFFLISLLSSLCLSDQLPLFQQMPALLAYLLSGCSLYLIMRIFAIMDRVPWLSVLTLLTQGILILFLIQTNIIPPFAMMPLFFALVAIITVGETVKAFSGRLFLGEYAAPVVGYMLGILWMFILAKGFWILPLVVFSYDIFEIVLSAVLSWIAVRRICKPTVPFLVEKAFETNYYPKKLVRSLFFILLFLSLLAFVSVGRDMLKNVIFLEFILLVGSYLRLKQWGTPQPRFRDIGHDLKQGLVELKKQLLYIPLKKDKVQKPVSNKKLKDRKK